MSIYTALRAGVSGLTANSSALAVISDNIANVNTVGYKRSGVDFSALVNAQNSNTTYNAGGVLPLTRQQISLQGSLEQSRSPTDMAISGDGFFIVSTNNSQLTNGGSVLFTRAGSFTIDHNGYMVNAQGLFLQGWPVAADGSVTSSPTSLSAIEPVNISGVGGLAEPTQNVGINANLQSGESSYANAQGPYSAGTLATGTITPDFESSLEIYDSLGEPRKTSPPVASMPSRIRWPPASTPDISSRRRQGSTSVSGRPASSSARARADSNAINALHALSQRASAICDSVTPKRSRSSVGR